MRFRIGFDIDGTITANRHYFAWLTRALRRDGYEVVILSLRRSRERALVALNTMNIVYDELVLPPMDFSEDMDALYAWKAEQARELKLDVLYDDDPAVARVVDRSTTVFVPRDEDPKVYLAHVDEQGNPVG